ncbi:uncharacterized protein LOC128669326 isoform X2 [Plodia interpunctella]|uniref:uncharacterized protein LOC128669326 isoform X2 n=1 Tax=Plodia interpunctella TaxID=58824 RepID=UPI0023679D15|nr:uncharacterized protein LOC128669326 isoform X2 [Plodia interpunctella]
MLVKRAMHLALLAVALLWQARCGAAPAAVKFCGRQLGEIMSRVCHAYNSPSWDVPTVVVEQTGSLVRRRRHLGIADECCTMGCTWEQLSKYCSVSAYSESPMDDIETHMIADRSAEQAAGPPSPAVVGNSVPGPQSGGARREVGRNRSRGYGRARARGRRCWCRRKRRSGRRRSALMGPRRKCSSRCARSRHRVAPANVGQNSQY